MCEHHGHGKTGVSTSVGALGAQNVVAANTQPALTETLTNNEELGALAKLYLKDTNSLMAYKNSGPHQRFTYLSTMLTNDYSLKCADAYGKGDIVEGDRLADEMGTKIKELHQEIFNQK